MQDVYFAASIDHHIFTIDLHSERTISDAIDKLDSWLYKGVQQKLTYCEVVTGIGSGALKSAIIQHLKSVPFIKGFQESEHGGSIFVVF